MSGVVEIRVFELLSARLCHELISPIGAIANGVELLGEDDPDFVRDAVTLIGQSAKKAGQRLQFYRFAYGSLAGAAAAQDPRELVLGLLEGGKIACDWAADDSLPAEWQKLVCNMVVLAAEALPRGGRVAVEPAAGGRGFTVAARGETVNLSEEIRAALRRASPVAELTSRTVQAYFTGALAAQQGLALNVAETTGGVALEARAG